MYIFINVSPAVGQSLTVNRHIDLNRFEKTNASNTTFKVSSQAHTQPHIGQLHSNSIVTGNLWKAAQLPVSTSLNVNAPPLFLPPPKRFFTLSLQGPGTNTRLLSFTIIVFAKIFSYSLPLKVSLSLAYINLSPSSFRLLLKA